MAYRPLAEDQALAEGDLVACELAVQAAWEYAAWIGSQVEAGRDPDVPDGFGWRFLRGMRSRLSVAQAQETVAHRTMREAVFVTSTLDGMLAQAIEALRNTA